MGIINITPDSFFSGSRALDKHRILLQAEKMLNEGADIIDIGGYSSRPGAKDISETEEWERLNLGLQSIRNYFPGTIISVDTFRPSIAKRAVELGADIINDISGGENPEMLAMVAANQIPIIVMHKKGVPATMQDDPKYDNVVMEVKAYLQSQLIKASDLGVKHIIIDPGFGFGKTIRHNYQLLRNLESLNDLHCPILIGISRKGMIWKPLMITPDEALNGSTVLHALALDKGAQVLRVHDVKQAKQCIELYQLMIES